MNIFRILLFLFLSNICYPDDIVKVNIVGYATKLNDFKIKLNPLSTLKIDNKFYDSKLIQIFCKNNTIKLNSETKISFKEIYIRNNGILIFYSIYGDQDFKGDFKIFSSKNNISIINYVSIDEYLASVLGSEMGGDFSIETLKAQAIVIRTYFYSCRLKNKNKNYDINNADGIDMVYRGTSFATKKMYNIIDETKNLYLLNESGKLTFPLFHSTSGGVILKDIVFNSEFDNKIEDVILIKDVDENGIPLSINSPYYDFQVSIPGIEIVKNINYKIPIKSIEDIKLKYFEGTECVDYIGFICSDGNIHWLKCYKFISMMHKSGYHRLQSIQFNIEKSGNNFIFTGNGFGHLCGMSQYSAEKMAINGASYIDILKKYYPYYYLKKMNL